MRIAAIVCLLLALPAVAMAQRTCDPCIDIDDVIFPTPGMQTVAGSTVGQANGEYTYQFCAVGGQEYYFTTCEDNGGGADYDTALSIWEINADACGTQMECNDDNCASEFLHSTVSFVAPADGDYLIVVDGFSTNVGNYTLGYRGAECQTTPTETVTWGNVKALYR